MVVNSYKPILGLVHELRHHIWAIVIYVVAISVLDLQYHLEELHFPVPIVAVLGTVIGLLLAFRTNSSYARWWEARILWGAIVNDSRTWVRQLIEFSDGGGAEPGAAPHLRSMAYRQIAWCYALSRTLRAQNPTEDLNDVLDQEEIESYQGSYNVPNDLLLRQAIELRKVFDANQLQLYQFVELEKTLTRLTDSMGGCERIRNTPFPASYSRMVNGMIYLFTIFLPFGLVEVDAVGLVLTSLSLSFSFLTIDRVAIYLQDPFSNRPSDTPMLSLSRTIEINIKQMLGETELPEKLAPVEGIAY